MGTAAANATAVIGIDVSKAAVDACLLTPDGKAREKAFANSPGGFAALLSWADGHGVGATAHFGMEATGGYEDALATHLHTAGRVVSVVNPTRIKYAGVVRGRRNKTDRADARLIAADTRDENPPAWCPPTPEVRELQALVRRRDDLRSLAAHEKARLESPLLTPAARRSVARVVKLLGKEADAMQAAADALVAATRGWPPTPACWRPSRGSAPRPPRPSWPSCRPSTGCRAPSRRRRTAGCPRGSSRAGRASAGGPG